MIMWVQMMMMSAVVVGVCAGVGMGAGMGVGMGVISVGLAPVTQLHCSCLLELPPPLAHTHAQSIGLRASTLVVGG